MYKRHSEMYLFLLQQRPLLAMCTKRSDIIFCVFSDGENKMTGYSSGCIARIEREAEPNFTCVWSVGYPFDLVVQDHYT